MKIIIFTNNGETPPKLPDRQGLEVKYVSFESVLLDDLLLIAKYRILDFPTSLIINDRGKVLLKVRGSIPGSYIDNISPVN